MALSQEELKPFLAKTREDQKVQHLHQLRAKVEAAQRVSELVADPRWEFFGRHVEAIRDRYQAKLTTTSNRIVREFLQGEEYLKVKMMQVQAEIAVKALNAVLLLAKTLIEQGEQAAEALKTLDNSDKSA